MAKLGLGLFGFLLTMSGSGSRSRRSATSKVRTLTRARAVCQAEMQPDRNAIVASEPRAERTAWSLPHLTISARVCGDGAPASMPIRALFVGMMPNRVQGQFAIIKTAPAMKARSPICHQASSPKIHPTTARGACIAKPRL